MNGLESAENLIRHDLLLDRGPVRVYEAGNRDGKKVFMLHGAMYDESRLIWDQLFPYLAEDYHVFAMDIPGHGSSNPWSIHLSHDVLIDIIHEVFGQLQLKEVNMIGLSMGGGLCIEFAAGYPEAVKSLVLFEPGGLGKKLDYHFLTYLYTRSGYLKSYLSRKYHDYSDEKLMKVLDSLFTEGSLPEDKDRLLKILKDEIKGKFIYKNKDLDDWQLDAIGPFSLKWNLLDKIEGIRCPSLWLRGKNSTLVKESEMKEAVSLINKNVRHEFIQLDGGGHMLPLEQPHKVNTVVSEFLSGVK